MWGKRPVWSRQATCYAGFLVGLLFKHGDEGLPPKSRLTFKGQHRDISHKIDIFNLLIYLHPVLSHRTFFPKHLSRKTCGKITNHFLEESAIISYTLSSQFTWQSKAVWTSRTPRHWRETDFIKRESPRALWWTMNICEIIIFQNCWGS
jgi:hypothetical protein